jgi:hypothetical protein
MDFNVNYSKNYTKDIIESEYIEINKNDKNKVILNKLKKFNYLLYAILKTNESDLILSGDCSLSIEKVKMNILSELCGSDDLYKKFKYKKIFTKKIIEQGLNLNVNISSILFIANYYNINIVLLYDNLYYKLFKKQKLDNVQVYKFNNGWIYDKDSDISKNDVNLINKELISNILTDDLKGKYDIHVTYLDSISKYKLIDLQNIAKKNNINTQKNEKNLKKLELYDEINMCL